MERPPSGREPACRLEKLGCPYSAANRPSQWRETASIVSECIGSGDLYGIGGGARGAGECLCLHEARHPVRGERCSRGPRRQEPGWTVRRRLDYTVTQIAVRRLHAQRLVGESLASAVDVVRLFGAVQSQDYAGAKWALGQRTAGAGDVEIDGLFDKGEILRTHVMRPTWHFVLPEDVRWLLDLTGARVRRTLDGRYRQLGIDEDDVARATEAVCRALAGSHFLTRRELGEVLRAAGIPPDGQRLPHLLMAAELDGVIISGPRRGKQFTYALLAERAPDARTLDRSEALAELTRRYFRSHGPAQIGDFVWWSGLTVSDARSGLALAAADLQHDVADDKDYWFDAAAAHPAVTEAAHLLPNWDEYTVGYRDRAAALPPDRPIDPAVFSYGSILSNVVTVAGRVRGSWRRTISNGIVRVEIRLFDRLDGAGDRAVEEACARLGQFLELPVELTWL